MCIPNIMQKVQVLTLGGGPLNVFGSMGGVLGNH